MKKIIAILAVAFITLGAASTVNAQSAKLGDKFCTVGLHTGAYTGDLGLGVNLDFYAGSWRGRLLLDGANLFNGASTVLAPAVDFHYVINIIGDLNIYPIVGVNAWMHRDYFNLGVDLGAGIEYCFTPRFSLFGEGKYQYMILDTVKSYQGIFGFAFTL